MLIGISGKLQSGKDTLALMLGTLAWEDGIRFEKRMFAGYVKTIVSLLTGIPVTDLEKSEIKKAYLGTEWNNTHLQKLIGNEDDAKMTVREMLQKVGTDAIRNRVHENAWVNALMKDYKKPATIAIEKTGGYTNHPNPMEFPNWIITDMRFPNEFNAIRDKGGICIRINRGSQIRDEKEHPSEFALDGTFPWDHLIANDGTIEELQAKAERIWKELNPKPIKTSSSKIPSDILLQGISS